jgi:hypothetical protein
VALVPTAWKAAASPFQHWGAFFSAAGAAAAGAAGAGAVLWLAQAVKRVAAATTKKVRMKTSNKGRDDGNNSPVIFAGFCYSFVSIIEAQHDCAQMD